MGSDGRCPICLESGAQPACRAVLYQGCEREVRACPSCGAAFYWPVPGPEDVARCYPPVYFRDFFRQYWKDYYKGRALSRRLTPWRREGDFLDVGCALGTMLAGVRDHSGWKVSGLELSGAAAALGRELNSLQIEAVPLARAPWPAGTFDYVHVNNVLEHEADPAGAAAAVARLLRPGGRLELIVPNGPVDLRPNMDLYRRLGRAVPTRHGGHLFFFSRASLETLLARSGLRVLSMRCFHFKLGLKARGLWPGAYKPFLGDQLTGAAAGVTAPETLTVEEGRRLIPARPGWPLYWLQYRLRRGFRLAGTEFGYDFEVMAEKP